MLIGRVRDAALRRQVHDDRTAAILGLCLGVSFTLCFLTGLCSHLLQQPLSWLTLPAGPTWLYRVTQGVHVTTGLASVPLLFAKLWSVFPRLFRRPPVLNHAHGIERLLLVPLVGGSVFMLFSGIANVSRWYPWEFYFPAAHFWVAWITIGALAAHLGAKARTARAALSSQPGDTAFVAGRRARAPGGLDRRGFLAAVVVGAGFVVTTTAGQTLPALRGLTLFAQRRPDLGPQGLPVNKTAREAGVVDTATDDDYRLRVTGAVATTLTLTADDLDAMAGTDAELPIACVEGWSASATWRGVPVRDLLARAGVAAARSVHLEVISLQTDGRYRRSEVDARAARDPGLLLAVAVNGERLDLDHGYPCRLIGPNRPGVMQTKWVSEVVVR